LNPDPCEVVSLPLGPEERRLVWSLREVPEGRLRTELVDLLDRLLASAREPRCAQMQADGVPCPCLGVACDECERAVSLFRRLRASAWRV
jgi:hypothetical protein